MKEELPSARESLKRERQQSDEVRELVETREEELETASESMVRLEIELKETWEEGVGNG